MGYGLGNLRLLGILMVALWTSDQTAAQEEEKQESIQEVNAWATRAGLGNAKALIAQDRRMNTQDPENPRATVKADLLQSYEQLNQCFAERDKALSKQYQEQLKNWSAKTPIDYDQFAEDYLRERTRCMRWVSQDMPWALSMAYQHAAAKELETLKEAREKVTAKSLFGIPLTMEDRFELAHISVIDYQKRDALAEASPEKLNAILEKSYQESYGKDVAHIAPPSFTDKIGNGSANYRVKPCEDGSCQIELFNSDLLEKALKTPNATEPKPYETHTVTEDQLAAMELTLRKKAIQEGHEALSKSELVLQNKAQMEFIDNVLIPPEDSIYAMVGEYLKSRGVKFNPNTQKLDFTNVEISRETAPDLIEAIKIAYGEIPAYNLTKMLNLPLADADARYGLRELTVDQYDAVPLGDQVVIPNRYDGRVYEMRKEMLNHSIAGEHDSARDTYQASQWVRDQVYGDNKTDSIIPPEMIHYYKKKHKLPEKTTTPEISRLIRQDYKPANAAVVTENKFNDDLSTLLARMTENQRRLVDMGYDSSAFLKSGFKNLFNFQNAKMSLHLGLGNINPLHPSRPVKVERGFADDYKKFRADENREAIREYYEPLLGADWEAKLKEQGVSIENHFVDGAAGPKDFDAMNIPEGLRDYMIEAEKVREEQIDIYRQLSDRLGYELAPDDLDSYLQMVDAASSETAMDFASSIHDMQQLPVSFAVAAGYGAAGGALIHNLLKGGRHAAPIIDQAVKSRTGLSPTSGAAWVEKQAIRAHASVLENLRATKLFMQFGVKMSVADYKASAKHQELYKQMYKLMQLQEVKSPMNDTEIERLVKYAKSKNGFNPFSKKRATLFVNSHIAPETLAKLQAQGVDVENVSHLVETLNKARKEQGLGPIKQMAQWIKARFKGDKMPSSISTFTSNNGASSGRAEGKASPPTTGGDAGIDCRDYWKAAGLIINATNPIRSSLSAAKAGAKMGLIGYGAFGLGGSGVVAFMNTYIPTMKSYTGEDLTGPDGVPDGKPDQGTPEEYFSSLFEERVRQTSQWEGAAMMGMIGSAFPYAQTGLSRFAVDKLGWSHLTAAVLIGGVGLGVPFDLKIYHDFVAPEKRYAGVLRDDADVLETEASLAKKLGIYRDKKGNYQIKDPVKDKVELEKIAKEIELESRQTDSEAWIRNRNANSELIFGIALTTAFTALPVVQTKIMNQQLNPVKAAEFLAGTRERKGIIGDLMRGRRERKQVVSEAEYRQSEAYQEKLKSYAHDRVAELVLPAAGRINNAINNGVAVPTKSGGTARIPVTERRFRELYDLVSKDHRLMSQISWKNSSDPQKVTAKSKRQQEQWEEIRDRHPDWFRSQEELQLAQDLVTAVNNYQMITMSFHSASGGKHFQFDPEFMKMVFGNSLPEFSVNAPRPAQGRAIDSDPVKAANANVDPAIQKAVDRLKNSKGIILDAEIISEIPSGQ